MPHLKIWRAGIKFSVLFNLATCTPYSITSYVKIPVFHFFDKVNKGQFKIVNVKINNGQILLYCHFNKIIKGPGTPVFFQSLVLNQKHIINVIIQHTSIWTNFILKFNRTRRNFRVYSTQGFPPTSNQLSEI